MNLLEINPKSEFLNPKQARMFKIQNVLNIRNLDLFRISILVLGISKGGFR
jgi:hypothetical protein